MSRDSGSEHPSQRTVAELLAEYGGGSQKNAHRRRRRAEDPSETAPQAIIERVLSDSGTMRAIKPDEAEDTGSGQAGEAGGAAPPAPGRPQAPRGGTGPQAPAPPAAAPPAAPQYGGPPSGPQPAGPPPGPPRTGPQPTAAPPAAGPPPVPAGPVPPAAPGPHAGPAPAAEPAPPEDDVADPDQSSGFWARRFAAAGAPPRATAPHEPEAGPSDAEMTVQQPALPGRAPAGPPPEQPTMSVPIEDATEQLPRVAAEAKSAGAEGTAMMAYPGAVEAPQRSDDPYDFDDYEDYDRTGGDYPGEAAYDDYADGGEATRYHRDGYDADDDYDDYDAALPAGLDADDYRDDDADEEPEQTTGKEWLVLALQGGAGLICGGAVWFAFRWLWTQIPIAALVAALAITGALVFVARKFLRTDDLQTILLAVLVGLICTVSPAALLLIGQ